MRAVTVAINANLPDTMATPATYKVGRIENVHGEAIGKTSLNAISRLVSFRCV